MFGNLPQNLMEKQSKITIFQNEKPGSRDMTIFGKRLLCNGKYRIQANMIYELSIQILK